MCLGQGPSVIVLTGCVLADAPKRNRRNSSLCLLDPSKPIHPPRTVVVTPLRRNQAGLIRVYGYVGGLNSVGIKIFSNVREIFILYNEIFFQI